MDAKTLSYSVALIGTALALLTTFLAVSRKERGLFIYAAAFVSAMLSFLLFLFQGTADPALGVVAANMFLAFYHQALAWGLRSCLGFRRPWPARFWAYSAAWLLSLLFGLYVVPSYTLRAVLSSIFIMLCSVEFMTALLRSGNRVPRGIRLAGIAAIIGFLILHAIRVALLLLLSGTRAHLLDNTSVSVFTFSFTLFYSVFWAGLILIIDAAGLLSEVGRQNKILSDLATTDELTGLANRHLLDIKVTTEVERLIRYREPLSLIIFDIDLFKNVNDTWGHQRGDEVLKEIASVTRAFIREPDNLFRWGGEEFLILAPHTGLAGAAAMAEKLRKAIEDHAFPGVERITASFGAAEWRADLSLEQWFKRADQALYRAKNSGRNRVVGFGADEELPIAFVRMEWRPEWNSGNDLVDSGHRKLLELSNALLDSALSRADSPDIKKQMDSLLAHVLIHFADEERVLEQAAYPELEAHAQLHRELVREALSLQGKVEKGGCEPGLFFDFLVGRVVIGHLLQSDVKFFPYLR